MKDLAIKKLYYSISEVSGMTGVKPYVLRYWESEFLELRPAKNRAGKRIYKHSDIELIELIKKLLYTERFTIEGAKRQVQDSRHVTAHIEIESDGKRRERLIRELKQELRVILELLENDKQSTA